MRNDLGLDLVELSLDLIEGTETFGGGRDAVERHRAALDANGLQAHATFTGLSAYSLDLLMHPDQARRESALDWYRTVIDLTASLGARATGGHVGAMSVPDWNDPERRAERWDGLKRDLQTIAAHASMAGLEYLLDRESRGGARAIDDGAHRGAAQRRRRRTRSLAALPRRRPSVRAGHRRR